MTWDVEYLEEAVKDLKMLDGSQKILVRKAIQKVRLNPLPDYEGGYGKPLGNKNGLNLAGLLKIKLKNAGIRIVYKLEKRDTKMVIVVIGFRADLEVYKEAKYRLSK